MLGLTISLFYLKPQCRVYQPYHLSDCILSYFYILPQ